MARRLLVVTQHVDPSHPLLASTVPKLAALAAQVDDLVVVALSLRPDCLPPNARGRVFGSRTRLGRAAKLAWALAVEVPRLRGSGGVLAHQCAVYAVVAAPFTRLLRVPLVLWYAHWHRPRALRLAHRLVDAIATTVPTSCPIDSEKVVPVGQAIPVGEIPLTRRRRAHRRFRAVVVGRYSPAKGLETIIRGVRLALDRGLDVELQVRGPDLAPAEQEERERLEQLVGQLGLEPRVRLEGPVEWSELPQVFEDADVLVNNHRDGTADQVVFEAAASGLPPLASNICFDGLLEPELRFAQNDPVDLADHLERLARLSVERREQLGVAVRRRVLDEHSVQSWAARVAALAGVAGAHLGVVALMW